MTVREGAKPYCRPIYVGFLSWKTASLVLARAKKLKESPFIFKQEAVQIFIEPLYSPKIAKQRKDVQTKASQLGHVLEVSSKTG